MNNQIERLQEEMFDLIAERSQTADRDEREELTERIEYIRDQIDDIRRNG
jgi:cob(I)alamin adenosyltransferase